MPALSTCDAQAGHACAECPVLNQCPVLLGVWLCYNAHNASLCKPRVRAAQAVSRMQQSAFSHILTTAAPALERATLKAELRVVHVGGGRSPPILEKTPAQPITAHSPQHLPSGNHPQGSFRLSPTLVDTGQCSRQGTGLQQRLTTKSYFPVLYHRDVMFWNRCAPRPVRSAPGESVCGGPPDCAV